MTGPALFASQKDKNVANIMVLVRGILDLDREIPGLGQKVNATYMQSTTPLSSMN